MLGRKKKGLLAGRARIGYARRFFCRLRSSNQSIKKLSEKERERVFLVASICLYLLDWLTDEIATHDILGYFLSRQRAEIGVTKELIQTIKQDGPGEALGTVEEGDQKWQ